MDNNNAQRPRKRVSRKVLRRRQLSALAVIAFLVLLFFILIAKGCSKSDDKPKNNDKTQQTPVNTTVTTTDEGDFPITMPPKETTAAPVVTTEKADSADVKLSKQTVYIDVGESDMPVINGYPDGSDEPNEVWTSSDEKIATVDSMGRITGVSPGECYVYLSFDNNPGIEVPIKVTVADNGVAQIPNNNAENTGARQDTAGEPGGSVVTYPDNILVSRSAGNADQSASISG